MADITKFFGKQYEHQEISALADAPVDTNSGLSQGDAQAFKSALRGDTIRKLAENKFGPIAQAVVALAKSSSK